MIEGTAATPPAASGLDDGMDLEHFLRVLRRRWVILVACVVALGGAAFIYAELQTKQYTATASVLFGSTGVQQQASGLTSPTPTTDPTGGQATNVLLLGMGTTAQATATALGHGLTAKKVEDAMSISPQGQSNIVAASATSTSPVAAARLANTFIQQFIAARRSQYKQSVIAASRLVQRQLASLSKIQLAGEQGQTLQDRSESLKILAALQTGDVQAVQAAQIPTSPSSPNVPLDTLLGVGAGLVLGLALTFLLERLDQRLNKPDEIEQAFGFTVLGHIQEAAVFSRGRSGSRNGEPVRLAAEAESFRMLRAHLRYYNVDRDIRTILVTSISPGEGKTTVAHNLAEAAASMGTRTLLIEADLRRPQLGQYYGLRSTPGLAEVLISQDVLREAIQPVRIVNAHTGQDEGATLDVLVSGPPPPNPSELLESSAMEQLLAWAAREYELVLIDAPPLALVSDAIPLATRVSGVLVVSRLGRSTRDGARRFHRTLVSLGAPVLGVIVNGVRPGRDSYYDYAYTYYNEYYEPGTNGKHENGAASANGTGQDESEEAVGAGDSARNSGTSG